MACAVVEPEVGDSFTDYRHFAGEHTILISEDSVQLLKERCGYFVGNFNWGNYETVLEDGFCGLQTSYKIKVHSYLPAPELTQEMCSLILTNFSNPLDLYKGWSLLLQKCAAEILYQLDYFCANPRFIQKLLIGGMAFLVHNLTLIGSEIRFDLVHTRNVHAFLIMVRVWIEISSSDTLSKIHFFLTLFAIYHGPALEEDYFASLKDLLFLVREGHAQTDLTSSSNPPILVQFASLKDLFKRLIIDYHIVLNSEKESCYYNCDEHFILYQPRYLTQEEKVTSYFRTHSFEVHGAVRMPCCFALVHEHCFILHLELSGGVVCPGCETRINPSGRFVSVNGEARDEILVKRRLERRTHHEMPAHFTYNDISNPYSFLTRGIYKLKSFPNYMSAEDLVHRKHELQLAMYRKTLYGEMSGTSIRRHIVDHSLIGYCFGNIPNMAILSIEDVTRLAAKHSQLIYMYKQNGVTLPEPEDIVDLTDISDWEN